MKFITSTDLKQWADTKECQQLLPELIKRLIDSSVSNINKLSFPSGDATFLPGWDGIVNCNEVIDLVPAGISLWECGTTDSVKSKIDNDFNKRDINPLGYDKNTSTFVFVTPRIWSGAEEWLGTHGDGWKHIVIYTAIELESWIEKNPSVGIWLAWKLRKLPSNGYILPEMFWERWAQGRDFKLPYEILLHGRDEVREKVVNTCRNKGHIILQSLSQSEGIAFAIASLATFDDAGMLISRTIVATEKSAFEDLVEHYDNLIILTNQSNNIHYSTKRGHSIIVASTPADVKNEAVKLPIIEKEGFINSLVKVGIDQAKARKIAKDTARDINVLRRRENIDIDSPKWIEHISELLPVILIGKWNENVDGDKEIIESLSGISYEQYVSKLHTLLAIEETPLIHISSMWCIRSPYEAIEYIFHSKVLTAPLLEKYRDICIGLMKDGDTESVKEMQDDGFHFHKFNQKYSNTIKEGVCQSLGLLAIMGNSENENYSQWVDDTVSVLLNGWNLDRYLSNRHFFTALAEASPDAFLTFVEKLPQEILDKVFEPKKSNYALVGWSIYYTELLFALEELAWDVEYLHRVTRLLLRFSAYKNDSNWANRPTNSLYHIYRFYLPQTYASFEDRMTILRALITNDKEAIYNLTYKVCESINDRTLEFNNHFKWRLFGKLKSPRHIERVTIEELNTVVGLMLQSCDYSEKKISELISLSFKTYMKEARTSILNVINEHIIGLEDVKVVVDTLRKEITHQKQCEGSKWVLTEEELTPYLELLAKIEPKDTLHKHAWLFNDIFVQLPHKRYRDGMKTMHEQNEVRTKALKEIVDEKGIDGFWNFVQLVKCPKSMVKSAVSIFNHQLNDDVCKKYKSGEISEEFARSYLYELYFKDPSKYISWAKQIISSDEGMTIVLYAPEYVKELANIATNRGEAFRQRYWQSIYINCWVKEDAEHIIRELVNVNRFSEVLEIIGTNRDEVQLSDVEIVQILHKCIENFSVFNGRFDTYNFANILEILDKSEDQNVVQLLIPIEFVMFRHLDHQMNVSNLRLLREISHNPELMIQLVEFAYLPDDKNAETLETIDESKKLFGECALYILHFGHNIVSFIDEKGNFDGNRMNQYIKRLYQFAKEKKRAKVIDYVVGDILGDIPRDDNYPPQALCEIVEELNSDTIDRNIYLRIYNSRGVTGRAYNEGGKQERYIASRFERFKEKTKLQYPRMTKIFEKLIKDYKNEAGKEDNEALIADLDY